MSVTSDNTISIRSWCLLQYTALHQHFGCGVTSVSFAFNWSRGRGAKLTCAVRRYAAAQVLQCKHRTSIDFMWCNYQSAGEMLYKYFSSVVEVSSVYFKENDTKF